MVMPFDECKLKIGYLSVFLHDQKIICTRNNGDVGIYKGDLGSPLISRTGQLIGIATWFTGEYGKPSIYTAIASYEPWILSLTELHESILL